MKPELEQAFIKEWASMPNIVKNKLNKKMAGLFFRAGVLAQLKITSKMLKDL